MAKRRKVNQLTIDILGAALAEQLQFGVLPISAMAQHWAKELASQTLLLHPELR